MLALSALLAVGLAACGSDDDDDAADTETTTAQEEGSDTIQIEYLDYAYQVSGPLTAGGTIEIKNDGKEFHMMGLGRIKDGKTLDDVKAVLESEGEEGGEEGGGEEGGEDNPTVEDTATTAAGGEEEGGGEEGGGEEEEDPLAEVADEIGLPGNFMSPGQSAAVTIPNLEPGTYAMICFLPQEGTGAPHFTMGMVNEFKVVEGDAPQEPTADATYKIAAGKAPDGPATLTAGEHTLKFEAVGDAKELEPGVGRLDAGKKIADINKAFEDLFESEEGPAKGAADQVPGDVAWGGFDLEDITSYYVTINFTPGDWFVIASDSDVEDQPETPKEYLDIKVT
jgi:hypothetical protein